MNFVRFLLMELAFDMSLIGGLGLGVVVYVVYIGIARIHDL